MNAEDPALPAPPTPPQPAEADDPHGAEVALLELLRTAQRSAQAWTGRCRTIDCEDVAQECLLLYWSKFGHGGAPERPEVWLRATVRNLCLRELRRLGTRSTFARELPDDFESVSAAEPGPMRVVEALDTLDTLYGLAQRTLSGPLRHLAALRCDPSTPDDPTECVCGQPGLTTDRDRRRALQKVDDLLRSISRRLQL